MKVLVIGFPKTGTKTLSVALRELGYGVYDFQEHGVYLYKEWMKIFTLGGTKEDFYRMYKDVDAACDTPACVFWKEILEAFPDIKMISMRRENEDIWYRSLMKHIEILNSSYTFKLMTLFSPNGRRFLHFCQHVNHFTFFGPSELPVYRNLGGWSPTMAKLRYRLHNALVLQEAPMAQTLEFNLSDGWEPLCTFLGKPIPHTPFPHKNKRGSIVEERLAADPILQQMMKEAVAGLLLTMTAVFAGGYLTYRYFPRKMFNSFP